MHSESRRARAEEHDARLRRRVRAALAAVTPALAGRIAIWAMLVLIAGATLAMFMAVSLASQPPAWWRTVDLEGAETRTLADRVESGVITALHKDRPLNEPWTVAISAAQANAWINVKLPRWLINRRLGWPERLAEAQVEFSGGQVSLGARLADDGEDQIVAATAAPRLLDSGALWLPIASTRAGRLDLPSNWTVSRLREWLPPEIRGLESTRATLEALAGAEPLFADASVRLEDGRRVRLIDIRAEEGRLLLTCVTEPPAHASGGED